MNSDQIMDEIERLTALVDRCRFENKEEVRNFVRNLTHLVYDFKMIGKLYDYYDETVEYYKQNRIQLFSIDEIVHQVIGFCAEFPDVVADIENIIVVRHDETFYKVFRRLRFKGTNKGYSIHGPATGKSLEDRCLNLTMMHIHKTNSGWKITMEINCDSEGWIREVQSNS